jgi:hypothetical protein
VSPKAVWKRENSEEGIYPAMRKDEHPANVPDARLIYY